MSSLVFHFAAEEEEVFVLLPAVLTQEKDGLELLPAVLTQNERVTRDTRLSTGEDRQGQAPLLPCWFRKLVQQVWEARAAHAGTWRVCVCGSRGGTQLG